MRRQGESEEEYKARENARKKLAYQQNPEKFKRRWHRANRSRKMRQIARERVAKWRKLNPQAVEQHNADLAEQRFRFRYREYHGDGGVMVRAFEEAGFSIISEQDMRRQHFKFLLKGRVINEFWPMRAIAEELRKDKPRG